jgi:predicted lipid-binding transport protein (Tim44 family)
MKKLMMIAIMVAIGGLGLAVDTAEAKRFGGGSSFGKKHNAPTTQPGMTQRSTPGQTGNQQGGAARSGMMGMIGGLALGGLLGAMFFGGGFEGINFFDFVIIGLIILGIVLFMRKRAATAAQQQDYAYAGGHAEPERNPLGEQTSHTQQQHDFSQARARPDIDEEHFVPAAKTIFMRMQKAWDEQDVEDIKRFCTPEVATKVMQDMPTDGSRNETEVGMLKAELVDAWMEDDQDWVSVHFTAMLSEKTLQADGQVSEESSSQANETWIFTHDPSDEDPTWYLAGIEQQ